MPGETDVQCPNCGHANSADARFCEQCGTNLEQTCPVCSFKSGPTAKFCSNCGAALDGTPRPPSAGDADLSRYLPETLLAKLRSAGSGHAMQGERRTVTMLFADIQGSTAAAEQMDPEDWATVVNGAFEKLIAPVYRYEGTLAQIQGDAVLAFFGAPVAHEDDPVRAIRAGLEIVEGMRSYSEKTQAEWGTPIRARVGINTGLVVVGDVGSDLRVEYTALGDAINVAARMEQTAQPGTVQVTSTTLALTGGVFEVEDLGPVEVKGKSEPVVSHRVLRFVEGVSGAAARPLVGRAAEIERLDGLRERLAAGSGWIASLVAEAGLGKSRLLAEMRSRAGEATSLATGVEGSGALAWMVGISRSYDAHKPFSTMRDLLARWWGIADPASGFDRVEAAAAKAGFDDPDMAALLGFVAGVALPDEAGSFLDALPTSALNGRVGEVLLDYFAALARERPCVVVFEDLQWADDLSLAFIESLMGLTESNPVGLLMALRPYREDPSWRIHEVADRSYHHRYHLLELAPLPGDETKALLEGLLDGIEIGDDVQRKLLERADGNPLFIEEMIRSFAEAGTGELTVPDSLSSILTARLDRLDDESRFAAQLASVLGVEFDREALGALLSTATVRSSTAELLRRGILVESGAESLAFRHALIRQTAYETILRRTRRDLHRQVADYLIEASPEASNDIAMHLVEGGEAERAFPYLIDAATAAIRSMALAEAIRMLTTAIENTPLDADPELVEHAHEALGEAYALIPDLSQASAAYQRLYTYGEQVQRPSARVAALNHLGYTTASIGLDLDGAMQYLDEARSLAEEVGDDLGLAQYHMNACYVLSMGGEIATAVQHDEATVDLGEKSGAGAVRLHGLVQRAVNYASLVDLEKAVPAVESAIEAAEEMGHQESRAILVAMGKATVAFIRGDIRGAVDLSLGAQSDLDRFASFYSPMSLANLASMYYMLGELEDALSHAGSSRRIARQQGQPFVAGAAAASMAKIYAVAGVTEELADLRDEATDTLEGPLADFLASSIWADLGYASLLTGDIEAAATAFAEGLGTSSVTQFLEKPRLAAGRAITQALLGSPEAAKPILGGAWAFVEARGYGTHRPLLHLAQAQVAMAEERFEEAGEALALGQQEAMETGQRIASLQILETRARLAVARSEDPSQYVGAGRTVVAAMAESIADGLLRERFVATWSHTLEHPEIPR